MTRFDGRANDEMRPITFERDYTEMAAGSVLVTFGKTVCCAPHRSTRTCRGG